MLLEQTDRFGMDHLEKEPLRQPISYLLGIPGKPKKSGNSKWDHWKG